MTDCSLDKLASFRLSPSSIKNGPLSPKSLFFYDPNGQLIGEYKDNTATITPADDWLVRQETIWLGDIPVGVITKPAATSEIQMYYPSEHSASTVAP